MLAAAPVGIRRQAPAYCGSKRKGTRNMVIAVQLILGVALLYGGAEWLVRGASQLARRLGVPALAIGLTIVAYGTSLPEQVVSLRAGLTGLGDISVGNVVGSNIFNIAVILGLSALVRPLKFNRQLLRLDIPIMLGVSVALILLLSDHRLGRAEGGVLFAGVILYTFLTLRRDRDIQPDDRGASVNPPPGRAAGSLGLPVVTVGAGLTLLIIGARLLLDGAVDLANTLGISQAVVGLTIVAVGTSLPELATSVVAAARNEQDIAIGNIVGSNIFNILSVLGLSSLVTPLDSGGIGALDLSFLLLTGGLFLPFLAGGKQLGRVGGLVYLLTYGCYLYLRWPK